MMIIDKLVLVLLNFVPSQYSRFINYPGFIERIQLGITNFLFLSIFLLIYFFIFNNLSIKNRYKLNKAVVSVLLLTPPFCRAFFQYAYDTPISFLCLLIDTFLILFIFYLIGKKILDSSSGLLNIVVGAALITVISSFTVFLGVNSLISKPVVGVHFLISILILYKIWNQIPGTLPKPNLKITSISIIIFIPFLQYLFSPAPPDADITTIAELTGFLFQGQSLSHVMTGVEDEWVQIRYPAGLPSLAWSIAHILNIRASEALLILWIVSFILVINILVAFGQKMKVPYWLILLFVLNSQLTGSYGFRGGQVQEQLAYAFGIAVLILLFAEKKQSASLSLSASIVVHPIVSIPFCVAFFLWNCVSVFRSRTFRIIPWGGICIIFISCIYILYLDFGEGLTPSIPRQLLNELSPVIFFKNIINYLLRDTYHTPFLLIISIGYIFKSKERDLYYLVLFWLFGAFLLDGLFGHTRWGGRFHGDCNLIGIWILSVGLLYKLITLNIKLGTMYQKMVATLFILFWLFIIAPGLKFLPNSVYVTHSDVRMGRYIERNLPAKSLIANIRPPGDSFSKLSFLRGNSLRNSLFSRVSEHQVKRGHIISRSSYRDCLNHAKDHFKCFRELGVTHVVVSARPKSQEFARSQKIMPLKVINGTYLFEL